MSRETRSFSQENNEPSPRVLEVARFFESLFIERVKDPSYISDLNEVAAVLSSIKDPSELSAGAADIFKSCLEHFGQSDDKAAEAKILNADVFEGLYYFTQQVMGKNKSGEAQGLVDYLQRQRNLELLNKKANQEYEQLLLNQATEDPRAQAIAEEMLSSFNTKVTPDERARLLGYLHNGGYDSHSEQVIQTEATEEFKAWEAVQLNRLEKENSEGYLKDYEIKNTLYIKTKEQQQQLEQRIIGIQNFEKENRKEEQAVLDLWKNTTDKVNQKSWYSNLNPDKKSLNKKIVDCLKAESPKDLELLGKQLSALESLLKEKETELAGLKKRFFAVRLIGSDEANTQVEIEGLKEIIDPIKKRLTDHESRKKAESKKLKIDPDRLPNISALQESVSVLSGAKQTQELAAFEAEQKLRDYQRLLNGDFALKRTLVMDGGSLRELEVKELTAMLYVDNLAKAAGKIIESDLFIHPVNASGEFSINRGHLLMEGQLGVGRRERKLSEILKSTIELQETLPAYSGTDLKFLKDRLPSLDNNLLDFLRSTTSYTSRIFGAKIIAAINEEAKNYGAYGVPFKGSIKLDEQEVAKAA